MLSQSHGKAPVPYQQIASGILPIDIICHSDLQLIFKSTDSYPACVKSQTALKLVERGWATWTIQTGWFELKPIECQNHWDERFANETNALGELYKIRTYFKEQGITILDARELPLPTGTPIPSPCNGSPVHTYYYFLVSESDSNKMIKLGYKTFTNPLPSNAVPVQ
jgi:hypothetical protein